MQTLEPVNLFKVSGIFKERHVIECQDQFQFWYKHHNSFPNESRDMLQIWSSRLLLLELFPKQQCLLYLFKLCCLCLIRCLCCKILVSSFFEFQRYQVNPLDNVLNFLSPPVCGRIICVSPISCA